jgi:hypothetical protein
MSSQPRSNTAQLPHLQAKIHSMRNLIEPAESVQRRQVHQRLLLLRIELVGHAAAFN